MKKSHEVFLRVLDAMHESTRPVLSKAHVYHSSSNSGGGDHLLSDNKTPKKSRKSFFRSLNQLRSEKQLKYQHHDDDSKGGEFSDSDEDEENDEEDVEDEEDDDETTAAHDSREQSLKTDIKIKVGCGVSQQSRGTKLASFYPLLDRLAFDLTLKDVCGDWKFSYLPLNIQIQTKLSYATLEEWCLAVLFRCVCVFACLVLFIYSFIFQCFTYRFLFF